MGFFEIAVMVIVVLLIAIAYMVHKIAYDRCGNDTVEQLEKQNAALRKQVLDLLSGETLPPGVQEKVDAIFKSSVVTKEKLQKGISDNQS